MAHSCIHTGALFRPGTGEVGLISQMLAAVIIIVTDTGTGRGSGQQVSTAADWIRSIIFMGAELARLHTAAVRTVIPQFYTAVIPRVPATAAGEARVCADTPTHVVWEAIM